MSLGFHVDTGTVCRAKSIESCPFSLGGHVDTVSRLESFWVSEFGFAPGVVERVLRDVGGVHADAIHVLREGYLGSGSPGIDGFGVNSFWGSRPPRLIQVQALRDTLEGLERDGVTQLVAACGTGKTFMARQLMASILNEGIDNTGVVLTPSIKLAQDTASEYMGASDCFDGCVRVIEVHSGNNHVLSNGSIDEGKIKELWESGVRAGCKVIIVSTYQSSNLVQRVQASNPGLGIGLLVMDEAHNVLGQSMSTSVDENSVNQGFLHFHDEVEGSIRAGKRLFMTATPVVRESTEDAVSLVEGLNEGSIVNRLRDVSRVMKGDGRARLTVYSTDEGVVGRVTGFIPGSRAVREGCLVAPKYHIRDVTIDSSTGFVNEAGVAVNDSDGLPVSVYSSIHSSIMSLVQDSGPEGNGSHDVLAYCGSINNAVMFAGGFRGVALELSGGLSLEEASSLVDDPDEGTRFRARARLLAEYAVVNAAFSGSDRDARLGREAGYSMFKDSRVVTHASIVSGWSPHARVLGNVDIFSEGVSINSIDTVIVNDASKLSERALTQVIGRAQRVDSVNGKTVGHVVFPRALNVDGSEVDPGLVAGATYGVTRVERAVAARRIRGETVVRDEDTVIQVHSGVGVAREVKAIDLSGEHVGTASVYLASQVIDRVDMSVRSIDKTSSPERVHEAKLFRGLDRGAQEVFIRGKVNSLAGESRDDSFRIASSVLEGESVSSVRARGRVVSSMLLTGDYGMVPESVLGSLAHSGIVQDATGDTGIVTIEDKVGFMREHSRVFAHAFASPQLREVPGLHEALYAGCESFSKGTPGKLLIDVQQGRVSPVSSIVEDNFTRLLEDEGIVEDLWPLVKDAKWGSSSPVNGGFGYWCEKLAGNRVQEGLVEMDHLVRDRVAVGAGSGVTGFIVSPDAFTRKGYLSASEQARLATHLLNS